MHDMYKCKENCQQMQTGRKQRVIDAIAALHPTNHSLCNGLRGAVIRGRWPQHVFSHLVSYFDTIWLPVRTRLFKLHQVQEPISSHMEHACPYLISALLHDLEKSIDLGLRSQGEEGIR